MDFHIRKLTDLCAIPHTGGPKLRYYAHGSVELWFLVYFYSAQAKLRAGNAVESNGSLLNSACQLS